MVFLTGLVVLVGPAGLHDALHPALSSNSSFLKMIQTRLLAMYDLCLIASIRQATLCEILHAFKHSKVLSHDGLLYQT